MLILKSFKKIPAISYSSLKESIILLIWSTSWAERDFLEANAAINAVNCVINYLGENYED
jgi:hypothetical protein